MNHILLTTENEKKRYADIGDFAVKDGAVLYDCPAANWAIGQRSLFGSARFHTGKLTLSG